MSGGVDSSVAAALFKDKDYEVAGVTMRIWDGDPIQEGTRHGCYGPGELEDIEDARRVSQSLGIPLYIIDLREEYKAEVLDYFCCEYMQGRTPNPCVRCNRMIKFNALIKKILDSEIEFDYFATGHYVRVNYDETRGRYVLKKAKDTRKDQSYFLFSLSQYQLSYSLFPLGNLTKDEVKDTARSLGLGIDNKQESQDFISGGDYALLFNEKELKEGNIVDECGKVLGRHRGIVHYTIGQRRGLGIAAQRPVYVTQIDALNNNIVVSDKEKLASGGLIADNINLIAIDNLDRPYPVKVKIRLNQKAVDATVFPYENGKIKILFNESQKSVCPGQHAVLYSDDIVIGGGVIVEAV